MFARKKVLVVDPDYPIDERIQRSSLAIRDKNTALKDSHLVGVSMKRGKTIASGDDTARAAFCRLSEEYRDIHDILWVNPRIQWEDVLFRIENSEDAPDHWFLTLPL